jgi:hypothetical protein
MSTKAILGLFARATVTVGAGVAVALSSTPAPPAESTAAVHPAAKSQQSPDTSGCAHPGADTTHWYVEAYQCGQDFSEVSATATIPTPRPTTDGSNAQHSNGQITLEGSQGDQANDIEVSWVSLPAEHDRIYLQVGRDVGSQKGDGGYPSADWVSYLDKSHPNPLQSLAVADMNPALDAVSRSEFDAAHLWRPIPSDISNKSSVDLKIHYAKPAKDGNDGQWQVFIDGKEIGYYPDKKTFGPNGFHLKGPSGGGRSQRQSLVQAHKMAPAAQLWATESPALMRVPPSSGTWQPRVVVRTTRHATCMSPIPRSILRTSSTVTAAKVSRSMELPSSTVVLGHARCRLSLIR